MGRRTNKNKEVDFFDFEKDTSSKIEYDSDYKMYSDNITETCSSSIINIKKSYAEINSKHKNDSKCVPNEAKKLYIYDKQDTIFLLIHKYCCKINNYSEIEDIDVILERDSIDYEDDFIE